MHPRLPYIDALKLFAILLVVLGHSVQLSVADYEHSVAFRLIYSFHMAFFMFLSGFVSYRELVPWATIKRRAVQLLVPFVSWAVLLSIYHRQPLGVWHTVQHPGQGLWFLWVLFWIILILKVADVVARRLRVPHEVVACAVAGLLAGAMVVAKVKLFGLHFVGFYFLFYCLGYFGRKHLALVRRFSGVGVMVVAVVAWLAMASVWQVKEPPSFMPAGSSVIYNYVWRYLTALVAIVAFMLVGRRTVRSVHPLVTRWGGVL